MCMRSFCCVVSAVSTSASRREIGSEETMAVTRIAGMLCTMFPRKHITLGIGKLQPGSFHSLHNETLNLVMPSLLLKLKDHIILIQWINCY